MLVRLAEQGAIDMTSIRSKGWLLAGLLAGLAGAAVVTGAADSGFHDRPASPRSLPADNLPPFGMLDDDGQLIPTPPMPAGALHRGRGYPPESTARGPALDIAVEAARAAVDTCAAAGYRIGAAVIDSAGEARALLTADGSDGSHVFVAMRKALTALRFRVPSSEAHDRISRDHSLLTRVTPNMFVEGGAVPILIDGAVIGAIGVSGAGGAVLGQQDESCALAALNKIKGRLNNGAANAH
jgi:uncharacterized protein GlcG (DUF336 family)